MSIFNDDRRYSDDPEEYLQWKHEVEMECRREEIEAEMESRVDLGEYSCDMDE